VQYQNIISQANNFGIGAQFQIANHQDVENTKHDIANGTAYDLSYIKMPLLQV
jgi:hypothetical protein